jgi:hypothetical protein
MEPQSIAINAGSLDHCEFPQFILTLKISGGTTTHIDRGTNADRPLNLDVSQGQARKV